MVYREDPTAVTRRSPPKQNPGVQGGEAPPGWGLGARPPDKHKCPTLFALFANSVGPVGCPWQGYTQSISGLTSGSLTGRLVIEGSFEVPGSVRGLR
jgi:hypothetical protein